MLQKRLIILTIMPSWISGICAVILTAIILGYSNWTYFTYNDVLYEAFYGDNGLITVIDQVPNSGVDVVQEGFASSPLLYGGAVIIGAIVVALAVFIAINSFEKAVSGIKAMVSGPLQRRKEAINLFFVRVGIVAVWAFYAYLSVLYIIPSLILMSRIGAEEITTLRGVILSVLAALLCIAVLHTHVFFARLVCQRPRIFGGQAQIEDIFL